MSRSLVLTVALGATLLVPVFAFAADGDASSMRVYRDPVTGEFTAPPSSAADAEVAPPALLGSPPSDLVEEPGSTDAGGVTMDLQGRFRSAESATIADDGAIRTRCRRAPAAEPRP